MRRFADLASQSRGAFLGAAVGDALGWPQEQNSRLVGSDSSRRPEPVPELRGWSREAGTRYQRYLDPVGAGAYSDDTQLILAVARSLHAADWFGHLVERELPQFTLYQRGAGGATLRACRAWSAGRSPWEGGTTKAASEGVRQYFRAGGNGVAMRIAPHLVVLAQAPPHELVTHVMLNGIATHGHPRALVGAAAYASALRSLFVTEGTLEFGDLTALVESDTTWQTPEWALSALPKEWLAAASQNSITIRQWEQTTEEMLRLLSLAGRATRAGTIGNDMAALDELGVFNREVNGSGTVTAAAAIYLASRSAPRPMGGLLRAAFLQGADTDTLASMTGALLGALHGPRWLESIARNLQDRDYIERMADACTRLSLGEDPPEPGSQATVDKRAVQRFTDELRIGGAPERMPDGRACRLITDSELQTRGTIRAHRWTLDVDGQTYTIDRTAHGRNSKQPEPANPAMDAREALPGNARLINVSFPAKELAAIEQFYRLGLGAAAQRQATGEVVIGDSVRFVAEASSASSRQHRVLLAFQVQDLAATAARLGIELEPRATSFRATDPMGNCVIVQKAEG